MRDHQHAKALCFHEAEHQLEQPHLVFQVERHTGLVEDQKLGLLRERARDTDALVLSSRESPQPAVGEVLRVAGRERAVYGVMIFGALSAFRTPTDIFPNIGIPVISVVWGYTGLPPDDMSGRIVSVYERVLSTTVNDIC